MTFGSPSALLTDHNRSESATVLEHNRLFSSARASFVASRSGCDNIPLLSFFFVAGAYLLFQHREDMILRISLQDLRDRIFPEHALKYVSTDGVAEPRRVLAPCIEASIIAASLALYRGAGSYCLKEDSCSSSTMTSPRRAKGRNTEERTPRIIRGSFDDRRRFQTSTRSLSENFEWYISSVSPKTFRSLSVS